MTLPSRLMRAGMLGWRPRATWSSVTQRTGWPKIQTLLSRTSAIIWQAGGALAAPPYPPRQAGRRVKWGSQLALPFRGGVGVGPDTDSRPAKRGGELGWLPTCPPLQGEG